jgi:P4 family phage/plasmid primase-like protien
MATESEIGVIGPTHLIELYKMGFKKLVPMSKNGNPIGIPTIENGETKYAWTPIYDNPHYWTEELLAKQSADFKDGIGVCLGDIGIRDEQGVLYHNILDIDSDSVWDKLFILQNPGPKCSLVRRIYEEGCVIKTRKPKGRHIHWLSHKQYASISALSCKEGFEFEIHTGKRCVPLPPTVHREDTNFHYKWEAKSESGIPVSDDFYDILLEVLQDCLKPRPDKVYVKDSGDKKQNLGDHSNGNGKSDSSGNGKADGLQIGDGDIEVIRRLLQPYYTDKRRNGIVFGVSGILHVEGISKDSAMALIDKIARNDGISREVDIQKAKTIVENTFRKERQVVCGKDFFVQNILLPLIGSRDIVNEISGKIYNIIHKVQDNSIGEEEKESETAWLRRNTISRFKIHTTRDKTRELFLYDDRRGVYLANQEWRIEEFCQSISHDVKTGVIEEVIKSVKRITSIERSELDSNMDIINLRNGLLNIHTPHEFRKHSPKFLSIVQLPIMFNPKARCPNILRFLGQVLKPKDVFTALQIFGYCLYKTAEYEKVFFLIGAGSNGKSTFLRLLEAFLGLVNISHETLQDLSGENKFSKAELFGKSANLYADLTRKSIKYTGTLKMLTSGDWVSAERKMQHRFQFRPYAKLVYSANQMPEIEDDSYAMHRRLVILPFENVFESNRDTSLINKLTTPEELSGLLNLALIALNQLIKDNGFAYIEDIKTVANAYTLNANSASRFFKEKCVIDPKERTLTTKFQNAYFNFCKQNGLHCKTDAELGKELPENVIKKRGPRPDRENYYYGIGLLENQPTSVNVMT